MDDIVRKAMARWPDVPAVYGWLGLDRRGRWTIKGEPMGNAIVRAFIDRNYHSDEQGRWYFQNGPQKVFVALEYTPFVYRLWRGNDGLTGESHTGEVLARPSRVWLDDAGNVLIEAAPGIGCLDGQSLADLADTLTDSSGKPLDEADVDALLQSGSAGIENACCVWGTSRVPVGVLRAAEVPTRFGFDPDPKPAPGQTPC